MEADSDDDSRHSPPPAKTLKIDNNACSNLDDIFGDVYVTKVVPGSASLQEQLKKEIEMYRKDGTTIALHDCPLLWWKMHLMEYPLLANVAKQVLCIPGTSVPSERVFSTAGDVVSAQRATLSPENVDMLIFLKQNIRFLQKKIK